MKMQSTKYNRPIHQMWHLMAMTVMLLMLAVTPPIMAQEDQRALSDSTLHLPELNAYGQMQPAVSHWPVGYVGMDNWKLHKGMNLMLGYYKNETETLAAIDEEGWLHTGDLGVIDSEGNIFIRGRKKNMLLGTNGQNIYPEEIEDIIMARTIFEESVVVQRGEKLVALVYVSDPALQHHGLTRKTLNEHLSTYKRQINSMLPHYANISAIEVRENEFEKTPKRNIKRYLYT